MLVSMRRLRRNNQLILSVLAAAIGVGAAYGAIGFRHLIDLIQLGALGFSSGRVSTLAAALPWWHLVLAPTLGGLAVGIFVRFALTGGRPQGVADVIEATVLRGNRMSLRDGIGAALASAASIGVGASVGREGPVVHLGATIASWVGTRLHLGRSMSLTLLGCGIASGIAASFNGPIAGVFFALEVVIGHYALSAFAPIVVASVIGTIISRIHFGDFLAFVIPPHVIQSFWEFPAFALLGVISALVAMAFMRAIMLVEDPGERSGVPRWLRPAIGGLLVGLIALAFPQVLGVGYEATDAALKQQFSIWLLAALVAAKLAATALSLGLGFGGGVFSPSLVVGAMLGGAFGLAATGLFPELSSGHGVYALVGMGAVAGAVLGAPISTILIVFELTADFEAHARGYDRRGHRLGHHPAGLGAQLLHLAARAPGCRCARRTRGRAAPRHTRARYHGPASRNRGAVIDPRRSAREADRHAFRRAVRDPRRRPARRHDRFRGPGRERLRHIP